MFLTPSASCVFVEGTLHAGLRICVHWPRVPRGFFDISLVEFLYAFVVGELWPSTFVES